MRVRPRPWQVFFALWIPMGALVLWLFYWDNNHRATDEIQAKGKRVTAFVASGTRDSSGRGGGASTVTAHLRIRSGHGTTNCRSTLMASEFERVQGSEIPVTLLEGPPPRCFTGTAYTMLEHGEIADPILGPMVFGAMLAWLLYYPMIRMEWSAAGSLKARWDAERAAARAARSPPSPSP